MIVLIKKLFENECELYISQYWWINWEKAFSLSLFLFVCFSDVFLSKYKLKLISLRLNYDKCVLFFIKIFLLNNSLKKHWRNKVGISSIMINNRLIIFDSKQEPYVPIWMNMYDIISYIICFPFSYRILIINLLRYFLSNR